MVSRDQGEGGVAVETLVAVVSGALVILSLLLFIIVVLVVRKQNYLAKVSRYFYITREKYLLVQCARSEDYILHSEQPLVAPHIPPPPPLPPSPLYNPEEYKVLDNASWIHWTLLHPGQVSGSAAPALSLHQRPVWLLEEMQSNALFSRQRRQLATEEEEVRRPLRSISGDTRVTRVAVTRVAVTRVP